MAPINDDRDASLQKLEEVTTYLASSRPTAVNLFWALSRMKQAATSFGPGSGTDLRRRLLQEAQAIHEEDRQMCHAIGRHGAGLLGADVKGVLTHCNAGGLATAEYGTALSIFFTAQDRDANCMSTSTKRDRCCKGPA